MNPNAIPKKMNRTSPAIGRDSHLIINNPTKKKNNIEKIITPPTFKSSVI
jgi:hypothetical protein